MKLRSVIAVLTVGLVSCNDVTGPEAPHADVRMELVDGRNTGAVGFYFLRPVAAASQFTGVFDPSLSPTVEICKLTNGACGQVIATYSRESGSGSERLRVDTAAQQYVVNWHTGDFNLEIESVYRVRVRLDGGELGHVDVMPIRNASTRKAVPADVYPVVSGATLPIAFRLEVSTSNLPALEAIPAQALPGAPVRVQGFAISAVDLSQYTLRVGAVQSPLTLNVRGDVITSTPLFLGSDKWPAPPAEAVDLLLLRNGVPVAAGPRALRVLQLPDAPGSSARVSTALSSMASSLGNLADEMPGIGREGQYLFGVTSGIEKLIDGPGEMTLKGSLAKLAIDDPASSRLVNALMSSTGLVAALEKYAAWIAVATAPVSPSVIGFAASRSVDASRSSSRATKNFIAQPGSILTSLAAADVVNEVTDNGLSRRMQLYEVIKLFGQTVIEETGVEFAETVGVASGVIGIVGCVPSVTIPSTIISTVLTVLNWGVNKLLVGMLPSDLIRFDLSVSDAVIKPGDITDAKLLLGAINSPPPIGVQDVIDAAVTGAGVIALEQACVRIDTFKEAAENTAKLFLDFIRQGLAAYTAAHPEANLDVPLFTLVPLQAWNATANRASLYERLSETPMIIAAEPLEVNWRASSTKVGTGRIYVRPASGPETQTIGLPAGFSFAEGAFGDDFPRSNTVEVEVRPDLSLEVDFPLTLGEGEPGSVAVRAGYFDDDDNVIYAAGMQISLSASGGILEATSGTTDSEGRFTTRALLSPGSPRVDITVSAIAYSQQVDKVVTATRSQSTPPPPPPPTVTVRVIRDSVMVLAGDLNVFSAEVTPSAANAVTWTATGGTITALSPTSGGRYRAGEQPGTFQVTATSVDSPGSTGTAKVIIVAAASGGYTGTHCIVLAGDADCTASSIIASVSAPFTINGTVYVGFSWTSPGSAFGCSSRIARLVSGTGGATLIGTQARMCRSVISGDITAEGSWSGNFSGSLTSGQLIVTDPEANTTYDLVKNG